MSKFFIAIKLAARNIRSNVVRTLISLLGIVIGVMAIILVLSFGFGMKSYVVEQIESFGSDIVEIEIKTPNTAHTSAENASSIAGGMQITTLKLEDLEEVAKLSNVGEWYAGVMNQQLVSYKRKNKQTYVMGITPEMVDVDEMMEIETGVMFSDEDNEGNKKVTVLGSKIKEDFFGEEDAIGKSIKIKGQSFRVVGVLKERGAAAFFDFDDVMYLPVKTLQKRLMGVDYVQFAMFKMKDERLTEQTVDEMIAVMREEHDIEDPDDDDFAVMSMAEAREILDKVFAIINFLLLSLTSISLIVGGVGIMNVMYVAVVERTPEIGLRKAVGAHESDLMWQFIWESIFITLIGGIIGIFLGYILT
ncbi:MAG: ABC transporter permease, partial [Candidatus Moranbacteria bacterium]|nr:ABC transporter permease [Candidatus Moranbacteria bacterium]